MNYHIAGENPAAVGRVLVVVVMVNKFYKSKCHLMTKFFNNLLR